MFLSIVRLQESFGSKLDYLDRPLFATLSVVDTLLRKKMLIHGLTQGFAGLETQVKCKSLPEPCSSLCPLYVRLAHRDHFSQLLAMTGGPYNDLRAVPGQISFSSI